MQLNNFNRYDRWQQLDALQAYLNKIRPPWELPEGYISPVSYATADYLENYAIKNKGGGWSIFDTTIDHYGGYAGYVEWMQKRRKAEIERLLEEVKVDTIFNELTNPCAKTIFTELENGIFKDHPLKPEVQVPINNSETLNFSEAILKLFNNSEHTHLTIQNGDTGNANAHTKGATITIGDTYLKHATKLSIARTMIHEAVHAYLNASYSHVVELNSFSLHQKMERYAIDNGYDLGSNLFHHNFMGQYVHAMAYSLYEWDKTYGTGGNLGWKYYKSMVYSGMFQVDPNGNMITEIDTFKELVPNAIDRQEIVDIILNEHHGNNDAKGTKCN